MVSRDYTKEIGVDSGTRVVSKPIAVAILAIAVAVGWFALRPLAIPVNPHVANPPPAVTR